MPKKKAPPDRGQRLLTLEELADELRAIGVQPERVLGMALAGERIAQSVVPFDPLKALEKDRTAIYSPRVLDTLMQAADLAQRTVPGPKRNKHAAQVHAAAKALTKVDPFLTYVSTLRHAATVLAMYQAHEALADALEEQYGGRASEEAWDRLANRLDVEVKTLKDRVTDAKKAAPRLPWPKLKRRGRKAW